MPYDKNELVLEFLLSTSYIQGTEFPFLLRELN